MDDLLFQCLQVVDHLEHLNEALNIPRIYNMRLLQSASLGSLRGSSWESSDTKGNIDKPLTD